MAHRVLSGTEPAWLCTHWSCSLEPGSWEGTANRNLACQLLKAIWDPILRPAVSGTRAQDLILPASHTDCLGWHHRGKPHSGGPLLTCATLTERDPWEQSTLEQTSNFPSSTLDKPDQPQTRPTASEQLCSANMAAASAHLLLR